MKDQPPVMVVLGAAQLGAKAGEGPAQRPCLSGCPQGQRHLTSCGDMEGQAMRRINTLNTGMKARGLES